MKIPHRTMVRLLSNPDAYARFQATGELPQGVTPISPLIALLEEITQRSRIRIRNIHLHPQLGYLSGARFSNAELLLRWLKPAAVMYGPWPAESARIKQFRRTLCIQDLHRHSRVVPAVIHMANGSLARTADSSLSSEPGEEY